MDNKTAKKLILALVCILAVCIIAAATLEKPSSDSPQLQISSTPSSSAPVGISPTAPSTLPVETIPALTTPPATKPGLTYIGNLYTRQELEKMDSKSQGYGAGPNVDGKNRPLQALNMNGKYTKYEAYFICPDDSKIYLTYNVTYEHEGNVQKTLDILKTKNVKCVFFVDISFVQHYPDMIQQIIDDGHILGNHCTTHPNLPKLSIDGITAEIMEIHGYVKETFGYEMRLFRPPSGYFSEQVLAIAQSLGYRTYQWSFTYEDWDRENQLEPSEALKLMTNALHSGSIYQLHAISSTNTAILEDFIDAARNRGYDFALLSA